MIRPHQRKLAEAAIKKLHLAPADVAVALRRYGEADAVEALSQRGFERLIDYFTVMGFRDRRRPIATLHTCRIALHLLGAILTDSQLTTRMHWFGISDFRDVDGQKLLVFLADLEDHGFKLPVFHDCRREVTPAQVRLLQVARRQLDIPDSRYLPMLQQLGAVNSAGDLDRRGFDLCMMWMEVEGFDRRRVPPGEVDIGKRQGFATYSQLRLIRTLWEEWSGIADEAALNAWLERYHRVSTLRFLTTQAAAKVIAALRAMKRRGTHIEKASA